ncbi:MAG: DUF4157 domain-containing protein [Chloroflexi bacterium]|nr:DUF4157 domain-containing protein [Chloroflexota bacterium]
MAQSVRWLRRYNRSVAYHVSLPSNVQDALANWYPRELLETARILRGSLLGHLFGVWGQAAVTINRTVHLTPRAPDLASHAGIALAAHELYHVTQQREMGWWRFLARYVWRWRPAHVRQGWRHPLEAPAYARADAVLRALGGPA